MSVKAGKGSIFTSLPDGSPQKLRERVRAIGAQIDQARRESSGYRERLDDPDGHTQQEQLKAAIEKLSHRIEELNLIKERLNQLYILYNVSSLLRSCV